VHVDVSSDVAFTNSLRQMLLQRDPARGWSSREPVEPPASDALIIACDPNREELARLAEGAGKIRERADSPLSQSLLQWTASGWEELGP
jgi:hypothetical protein